MDMSRQDSRSTLSDCSYSSGFQSMLGSPTGDQEFPWSNIQDLESRVQQLERGPGVHNHPHYCSTPAVCERSRHDSASSSCSTVIDSSHVVDRPGDMLNSQGKLLLENNLTLTEGTLDSLKKYSKVEVKLVIIGAELREPEECTCAHGCNQKCSSGLGIAELERRLQQVLQENQMLQQQVKGCEKLQELNKDISASVYEPLRCETGEQETTTDEEEEQGSSVVEYSEETSKAHIEELKTLQKERTQNFTIKSVVDPRSQKVISFDDAVAEKIIQLERGIYFNTDTGEEKSIPQAMRESLIKVGSKTTRWANMGETSVGIMTIKRNRTPAETQLVKEFMDTETGQMVSKKDAIRRGITDSTLGSFKDLSTGGMMNILQAIDKRYVTLEGETASGKAEEIQCIYKVSGVMDKRTNEVLSFREAVIRGILVKENGLCKDTSTGKYIYVGFALMSGLMQVDPIESVPNLEALQY